ncbi:hypothetical protein ANCCAN_26216 [Ancylostoma caninum]|uniref:Uncharacterized protein n=1 Tax=Ancylostoma caninum TaxID=29170 RepID=A0A368F7G3_ANCCA|nr:hypothetical protein ANCCAN_26216 [Ancylostoma caninum]
MLRMAVGQQKQLAWSVLWFLMSGASKKQQKLVLRKCCIVLKNSAQKNMDFLLSIDVNLRVVNYW